MADAEHGHDESPALDLSDVDHRLGQLVGGGQLGQLRDPCQKIDIRRWVMAMDYANPIHWDEEFARASRFGGIVAPQSMAVSRDYGHGCQPACAGRIPGGHLIFGGEEWWYYGHVVRPGDQLIQERRFSDYKVTETRFAGPTLFSRGDTMHRTQHANLVAKSRSTAIRCLTAEAERRGMYEGRLGGIKRWTAAGIAEVDRIRHGRILTNQDGGTLATSLNEVELPY